MRKLSFLIPLAFALTCSSCSRLESWLPGGGVPEGHVAVVNGDAVPEELFAGHLQYKNLKPRTERQRQRMLDDYLQREALTRIISSQKDFDAAAVQAELDDLRREVIISRYFERHLNSVVDDQAIRSYFDNHPEEFAQRKVRVAHVLVRLNRTMNEQERQARLTTAREAHALLRRGDEFAEVAAAYSEDAVSVKNGGDLGWLREGAISPTFSQMAFSLQPGEISEPFETTFGYHVIKVLEAPSVIRQPFAAVKGNIRHQLRAQAKEQEIARLLGQIEIVKADVDAEAAQ
nr:peptidylprolyl isomerase [Oceanococcus sp. HetDA_MAG_MS8]